MKNLREEMPATAAQIDRLRQQFGLLPIDRQIRRGMKGEMTFYARENGHEIGTPSPRGKVEVWWDERNVSQVRPVVLPDTILEIKLPESRPLKGKK